VDRRLRLDIFKRKYISLEVARARSVEGRRKRERYISRLKISSLKRPVHIFICPRKFGSLTEAAPGRPCGTLQRSPQNSSVDRKLTDGYRTVQ